MRTNRLWMVVALACCVACSGENEEGRTLSAQWSFAEGDCTSAGVETVSVVATPMAGATLDGEFTCADGSGELGQLPEEGATYSIDAQGLDADGVVRAENFGQTASFPDGRAYSPIPITLHPKSAAVVVSWSVQGQPCPGSVIIPFHATLYEDDDGELGAEVATVQETCSSGQATLEGVAPGDYIAEVDSRAVTPAVRGTAPVSVVAGEDAEVSIDL